jgi:diguanylate cyclase (GGDEF)-like protein
MEYPTEKWFSFGRAPRSRWGRDRDLTFDRLAFVVSAGAFALAAMLAPSPAVRGLSAGALVLIGVVYGGLSLLATGRSGAGFSGGDLAADVAMAALLFLATGGAGLSHLFLLLPIVDAALRWGAVRSVGATLIVLALYEGQALIRGALGGSLELGGIARSALSHAVAMAVAWAVLAAAGELTRRERGRRKELEAVAELAGWDRSPEEVSAFSRRFAARSCEASAGRISRVYLLDRGEDELRLVAAYDARAPEQGEGDEWWGKTIPRAAVEGLLEQGEIVVGDLGGLGPALEEVGLRDDERWGVLAPLVDAERARGLLVVGGGSRASRGGFAERSLSALVAETVRFLREAERIGKVEESSSSLARRLEQRENADRLADLAARTDEIDHLLDESLRAVLETFSAPAGGLLEVDRATGGASYASLQGIAPDDLRQLAFSAGEETSDALLGTERGTHLIELEGLEKVGGTEAELARACLAKGLNAVLSTALVGPETTLGALHLFWAGTADAERAERAALDQAARWLGVVLSRERSTTEVRRRLSGLAVLDRFSQRVSVLEAVEEVLNELLEAAREIVKCDSACTLLWKDELGGFVPKRCVGHAFSELRKEPLVTSGTSSADIAHMSEETSLVYWSDSAAPPPWLRFIPLEAFPPTAVVPISAHRKLFGAVCLAECTRSRFDDITLDLVGSLSRQAAGAIERITLFEQLRKRENELRDTIARLDVSIGEQRRANVELSVLHKLNTAIQSTIELEEILSIVVEGVRASLGFKRVLLSLLDDASMHLERKAAAGLGDEEFEDIRRVRVPVGDLRTLLREEFRVSNSYLIIHTDAEEDEIRHYVERYGYTGSPDEVFDPGCGPDERWHPGNIFVVSLRSKDGRLLGTMSVDSPEDGRLPSEERIKSLEAFASSASLAIENAKMYVDARRMLSGLSAVSDISTAIGTIRKLDSLLDEIVSIIHRKFAYVNVAVLLVDASKDELYVAAARGYEGLDLSNLRIKVGEEGVTGWVAHTGQAELVPNSQQDPRYIGDRSRSKSEIAVPLLTKSGIIGVLDVEKENASSLGEYDLNLLCALSTHIAVALENAKLYEQTERLAVTDAMTGLYNYRYFQERLAEEVERAGRRDQQLCLLMADIDNFKMYNDTFGHLRGDEVLRDMAQLLQQNVRQMDVVTRYGGDEFMIILPETDRDEALSIAERIRFRVGSWGVHAGVGPTAEEIGVSIGIAVYPDDAQDADGLIDKVDKALYKAKEFKEVGISFLYSDGG